MMLISASSLRNSDVLVSRFRMRPSLCCTSGWPMTTTSSRGLDHLELRAAPRHVHLAGRADLGRPLVGRGRPLAGHGGAMHDPAVARLVPRPPAVEHAAVVPHDEIADLPAMRVDQLGPGGRLPQLAE